MYLFVQPSLVNILFCTSMCLTLVVMFIVTYGASLKLLLIKYWGPNHIFFFYFTNLCICWISNMLKQKWMNEWMEGIEILYYFLCYICHYLWWCHYHYQSYQNVIIIITIIIIINTVIIYYWWWWWCLLLLFMMSSLLLPIFFIIIIK